VTTCDLNLNDSPSNHDNPLSRNHQAPSHGISQWKKLKAYLINAYLEGLGSDGSERLLPIFIASDKQQAQNGRKKNCWESCKLTEPCESPETTPQ